MNAITGYKAYNQDFTNNYGEIHEVGKSYILTDDIKWRKVGFHYCQNLEDVFRYYNAFEDIVICKVTGYGIVHSYYDEYYGYDISVSNNIFIEKMLSRDEIIAYGQSLTGFRLYRFIMGIKLSNEEIEFIMKNKDDPVAIKYLEYYQWGEEDAFRR